MNTYFRKIGRGLAGIFNFNGRMALHDFWPYAVTVVLVLYGLGSLVGLWFQFELSQRMGMGVWFGGDYELDQRQAEEVLALMQEGFRLVVPFVAISLVVHVIPLAAAIVRRLHDAGRTGFWILMPLPFGVGGIYAMDRLFSRFPALMEIETQSREAGPVVFAFVGEMFVAIGVALGWLSALVVLIILLCGKHRPQSDRFGPPPVPIGSATPGAG